MYPTPVVFKAAEIAADRLDAILIVQPQFNLITTDQLIEWSGLAPPTNTDPIDLHKQWNLTLLTLRAEFRMIVLERTGRWPKTLWGEGFKLLDPEENVAFVDTNVLKDISKSIGRGRKILRLTRNSELSDEDRRRKQAAETRMSALASHVRKARVDATRLQRYQDAPVQPTITPPTQDN
jgi:hypothetical protein